MASPARIVCIPSSDAAFAADVHMVAERIPGGLEPGEALAWFTTQLHQLLPTATVREQDPLARPKGGPVVWYVTRRRLHFRIDTQVWVPLPPAMAFRVYVERVTEWQTAVNLRPRHENQPVVGAEYDATYSFFGRQVSGVLRILAADPGRSVSVQAEGSGISVWYVTSFGPDGDGTAARVRGDYELPDNILGRIADRLGVERAIGRDIDRANQSYQRLCIAIAGSAGEGPD